MKCLITGGAGFIGSHLAEHLVAAGHDVIVYDDLSTGSIENVAALLDHPRFRFVQGDILDADLVNAAMHGCDDVYHLAATVGVQLVLDQPVRGIEVNMVGTEVVVRTAAQHRCRLLFTSSSEVYGNGHTQPLVEKAERIYGDTRTFRWAYAGAKALAESLVLAYAARHGLRGVVLRLFNVVGPRQSPHYGMVVPRFVRQALEGAPITVYGTGLQSRCFSHVGDIITLMPRLVADARAYGTVVNVGSNRPITIASLAGLVRRLADSSSPILTIPYDDAYGDGFEEITQRVPDLSHLEAITGYRPTHSIETIVADVIAHERARLKSAA